jgi:large subunit ribosomal protein L46
LKSDHEIRKEKEKRQQELIKSGKLEIELDADSRSLQTAQDYEDLNQEELTKFKFESRETEDDKSNNLKSFNRKLDDTLMLICGEKVEKTDVFLLPQAKWVEGETLRQTAERIVSEKFGEGLKVQFYGHAPCGFYKSKYKTSDKSGSIGSKVFFYRAAYKSGAIATKNANIEWLNEEELKGKVRDSYYKSVSQFFVS